MTFLDGLSKRERELLKIVFSLGEATAREICDRLGDGTSYSAVRAFLAALEAKGRVGHRVEGQRYLWSPIGDPEREGASLLADTARTFFKGSRAKAVAALIGMDDEPITDEEYRRLKALIEAAKRRGK